MITEDYVSFEIAKLLKEKGFDWIVHRSFLEHDNIYAPCDPSEIQRKDTIAIPTLQMAMKWLRKVHNLSVEPFYDIVLTWCVDIRHIGKITRLNEFESVRDKNYDSYEKACEAGIKYCLENVI
jgi:hypothetical protein